jgi:hypothetical protein
MFLTSSSMREMLEYVSGGWTYGSKRSLVIKAQVQNGGMMMCTIVHIV